MKTYKAVVVILFFILSTAMTALPCYIAYSGMIADGITELTKLYFLLFSGFSVLMWVILNIIVFQSDY